MQGELVRRIAALDRSRLMQAFAHEPFIYKLLRQGRGAATSPLPDPAPDAIDPPNNAAFVAVHTGFEIQIDEEARGDRRFGEPDGSFFARTGAIYKITSPGTGQGQQ